jgi:hypothetical protein
LNPATGTFSGTPPAGAIPVDIQVTASDGTLSTSSVLKIRSVPTTTAAKEEAIQHADSSQPGPTAANTPASGTVVISGSQPSGPSFAPLVLNQPVDSTVGASRLNPNAPTPGFNVPAALDLNALPATAAGHSDLFGFPVTRVSQEEALRTGGADAPALGGHWLFVYHGIPNMQLSGDGIGSARVPEDAFAHTDPTAIVQLDARLIDGSPLPSWLKFEGLRGQFTGVPPEGFTRSLEIEVVARDSNGREARALFVLLMEDLRNQDGLRAQDVPDLMLGLDVDAKESPPRPLSPTRCGPPRRAGIRCSTVSPGPAPGHPRRAVNKG